MTEQLLYDIGDLIMVGSMVGAVVFAFSYGGFFNWKKTAAGRSLMGFVVALVAWAGLSTFTRLIDEYWGRPLIRVIVFAAIFCGIWGMVFTLWRYWRHTPQQIEPRPTTKEIPHVPEDS